MAAKADSNSACFSLSPPQLPLRSTCNSELSSSSPNEGQEGKGSVRMGLPPNNASSISGIMLLSGQRSCALCCSPTVEKYVCMLPSAIRRSRDHARDAPVRRGPKYLWRQRPGHRHRISELPGSELPLNPPYCPLSTRVGGRAPVRA